VESSYLQVQGRLRDQLAETGHDHRPDDLARLMDLGVQGVRYPVLWGRPSGPETDWEWAADRLDRLDSLGIEPVVELLHHGFGPRGMDPLDAGWPSAFAAYAGAVAGRFPWIRRWLPINEPLTTARFCGLYGWWWPHAADRTTFVRLLLTQCLGYREAARAIRRRIPDAVLVVNEDAGITTGERVAPAVAHDAGRRWLTFDLLTGAVDRHHPLWDVLAAAPGAEPDLDSLARDPEPPDVLGLDHYVTSDRWLDHRLPAFPSHHHGGGHRLPYADVEAVRVQGAPLSGFRMVIDDTWGRYHRPLALTEVQLSGEPVDQVAWWRDAWAASVAAVAAGVEVIAVTAWSVFGSWDWDTVLTGRGRWEPGCLTPGRPAVSSTGLAEAIHATARRGDPGPGPDRWWGRADRALYHPDDEPRRGEGPSNAVMDAPPELVVGVHATIVMLSREIHHHATLGASSTDRHSQNPS